MLVISSNGVVYSDRLSGAWYCISWPAIGACPTDISYHNWRFQTKQTFKKLAIRVTTITTPLWISATINLAKLCKKYQIIEIRTNNQSVLYNELPGVFIVIIFQRLGPKFNWILWFKMGNKESENFHNGSEKNQEKFSQKF